MTDFPAESFVDYLFGLYLWMEEAFWWNCSCIFSESPSLVIKGWPRFLKNQTIIPGDYGAHIYLWRQPLIRQGGHLQDSLKDKPERRILAGLIRMSLWEHVASSLFTQSSAERLPVSTKGFTETLHQVCWQVMASGQLHFLFPDQKYHRNVDALEASFKVNQLNCILWSKRRAKIVVIPPNRRYGCDCPNLVPYTLCFTTNPMGQAHTTAQSTFFYTPGRTHPFK